jgi:hypothetical protein
MQHTNLLMRSLLHTELGSMRGVTVADSMIELFTWGVPGPWCSSLPAIMHTAADRSR